MPIRRHYYLEKPMVVTVYTGVIDRATISCNLKDHIKDPMYRAGMSEIVDLSGVTDLLLDFGGVRSLVREKIQLYQPQSTVSIFAPGDMVYGMARMYQELADLDGGVRARVCRTQLETLAPYGLSVGSLPDLLAACVPGKMNA